MEDFPNGLAHGELALQAKIFEASHTYKIKGRDQYLTLIEENGRRFYKAFVADCLDGEWRLIADTFASWKSIQPVEGVAKWTDNVSHGELIRDSVDQRLVVDPAHLQFLFQGMMDADKKRKGYVAFQWCLGLLIPLEPSLPGK